MGGSAFLSVVVSFCAAEEGPESREEAKKARGGRMQHRGEGGGGERGKELRRLKSQNPKKKEDRRRRDGASEVKKWEGMGGGRGPRQEAGWRRGYVQEETHQQGV